MIAVEAVSLLLQLSALHLVVAMVPGPNTITVGHCAASLSRRAGLTAAAGVAAASVVWVSLSLAGISVVLMQAGDLFHLFRLAGAAYLVFVGVRLLRARRETVDGLPAAVPRSPFLAGLFTTLGNPKSAVFWTSVFALTVPAEAAAWMNGAIVALIGVQSMAWYAVVALAFSAPLSRRHYAGLGRIIDRIAGAVMLFFGLRIAADLRNEIVRAS